jgi:hypothetical protein
MKHPESRKLRVLLTKTIATLTAVRSSHAAQFRSNSRTRPANSGRTATRWLAGRHGLSLDSGGSSSVTLF